MPGSTASRDVAVGAMSARARQPAERRCAAPAGAVPDPHDRRHHRQARPGRGRAASCRACARSAASTSSPPTARTSPAAWASPSSTAEALFAAGVDVITSRQPHLGQARDLPVPRQRASASCGRSTTAPTTCPGRGWGIVRGARRLRDRGRSTSRAARTCSRSRTRSRTPTGCSTRRREPLPPIRLVDFHCELTSREERARAVPRRAGERRRRHAHPRRHRRRADPPQGHGVPDRPRDDRPASGASSASSPRPSCRASSTPCRRGSRWGRGRSSSTPARSTSTRRPAAPSQIERIQRVVEV